MSPATIQSTYVFMCIARFVPECKQSGISRQIFVKFSNIKFHGTLIIASRADTCRLSDGLTDMTKLIGERTCKLYIYRCTKYCLHSFHYRQTCSKSLANFLFPIIFFCNLPHSWWGIISKVTLPQRGLSCVFLIRCCGMFL